MNVPGIKKLRPDEFWTQQHLKLQQWNEYFQTGPSIQLSPCELGWTVQAISLVGALFDESSSPVVSSCDCKVVVGMHLLYDSFRFEERANKDYIKRVFKTVFSKTNTIDFEESRF